MKKNILLVSLGAIIAFAENDIFADVKNSQTFEVENKVEKAITNFHLDFALKNLGFESLPMFARPLVSNRVSPIKPPLFKAIRLITKKEAELFTRKLEFKNLEENLDVDNEGLLQACFTENDLKELLDSSVEILTFFANMYNLLNQYASNEAKALLKALSSKKGLGFFVTKVIEPCEKDGTIKDLSKVLQKASEFQTNFDLQIQLIRDLQEIFLKLE